MKNNQKLSRACIDTTPFPTYILAPLFKREEWLKL